MATPPATTLEKDQVERVLHIAVLRQPRTRIIQIAKDIRATIRSTHRVTTEKVEDIIAHMVQLQASRQQTSLHRKNMDIVAKFIQTRIERYTNHRVVTHCKIHSIPQVRSATRSDQAVEPATTTQLTKVKTAEKGSKLCSQATLTEAL